MNLSKTIFFSDTPTKKQLKKLTINELVILAKQARAIKYPFKTVLIKYIQKVGLRK